MSQLQKSLQSIETGRYLLTWIVSRADIFFFAYRCLDFVTSAHEPLERTSLILESLLPEFAHEATDNDPTVVEHRTDRVFRSMRPSGLLLDLARVRMVCVIMAAARRLLFFNYKATVDIFEQIQRNWDTFNKPPILPPKQFGKPSENPSPSDTMNVLMCASARLRKSNYETSTFPFE